MGFEPMRPKRTVDLKSNALDHSAIAAIEEIGEFYCINTVSMESDHSAIAAIDEIGEFYCIDTVSMESIEFFVQYYLQTNPFLPAIRS